MLDNIGKKLIGNEDERAVSPVIGVILMVAITVILAAVIAAFVLDLGQGQSATASAGFDFDQTSDGLTVTLITEDRVDEDTYEISVEGDEGDCSDSAISDVGDSCTTGASWDSITITAEYQGDRSVIASQSE